MNTINTIYGLGDRFVTSEGAEWRVDIIDVKQEKGHKVVNCSTGSETIVPPETHVTYYCMAVNIKLATRIQFIEKDGAVEYRYDFNRDTVKEEMAKVKTV